VTGDDLKSGRERKGWTQQDAAAKLGVSQPYLSLMEKRVRRVPDKLAREAAAAFGLSAATLPLEMSLDRVEPKASEALAVDLASLGYPGFAHVKSKRKKNPAEILLSALSSKSLEMRVVEALPWVLLKYPDLEWPSLVSAVKVKDLQNKLGFVISLARRVAENRGDKNTAELLRQQEQSLNASRLVLEDTLCNASLSQAERSWLKTNRSAEAKHWRVLTDLLPDHLSHAY
jgi:transcriptional regulator with XRE-family HTH domain